MLHIGDKAPLFEADSSQGKIRLQDYIGKQPVVLIFYPMDETPGCTAQLCAVRDSKKLYESAGAAVFGVNPGSAEHHKQFAEHHGFDFPIIVDEGERIRKLYGVGKILGLFLQQRIVYAIGKDETITFAKKGSPPASEILASLPK
ncbi:peroxiredoxin [Paenibacillus ginsengarvi]|uniref:thioredoxin-dependent peroxiredoxin n=1 Tax=Paenibacillus ginsengarvi TaxID=400777 RepID=A0A3B0CKE1_9BACL|nr:peroxiredoxin [Paenibacillus ginsengarvi]RKN85004.1 peroxiredoxin [Paenibacillus ginsengarvi]